MTDEKIVELYWNRDETAINATQEKYGTYLMKIANNILSDYEDSRESVNDTYLAAWNSIPPNKPEVLKTYLVKLTRRISIDIFRKKTRVKRQTTEYSVSLTELNDCISDGNTPEKELETELLGKAINDFLSTLPEDSRNLFIGRYYFLDPLRVAAKYCGMGESKAKSMLFRIRIQLKSYLRKEGFDI